MFPVGSGDNRGKHKIKSDAIDVSKTSAGTIRKTNCPHKLMNNKTKLFVYPMRQSC